VTIGGTSFFDPNVSFNGIPAYIINHSDTQINALVPPGATTGPIAIVTPGGSVTTATQFTVLAALTALTPNQEFLDQAYHDLLGRPIDPAALTSFAGLLGTGQQTRQQILQMIVTSAEYRQDEVMNLYQTYLHRSASSIESNNGVTFFNGGGTYEQLIAQLIGG